VVLLKTPSYKRLVARGKANTPSYESRTYLYRSVSPSVCCVAMRPAGEDQSRASPSPEFVPDLSKAPIKTSYDLGRPWVPSEPYLFEQVGDVVSPFVWHFNDLEPSGSGINHCHGMQGGKKSIRDDYAQKQSRF
jgi:hypothetical protein